MRPSAISYVRFRRRVTPSRRKPTRKSGFAIIYEQRIYHAMPGRLPDLLERFEQTTIAIWERFGIRQAGFWTVVVGSSNQDLIYLLAWASMAEREQKWTAFATDPEWLEKRAKTEENGALVSSIDNAFLQPTAFSVVK